VTSSQRDMFGNMPAEDWDGYRGDRETPPTFFALADRDIGPFDIDVAANDKNHLCDKYFTLADDALGIPWGPVTYLVGRKELERPSRCWCNCPFPKETIGAFAAKALGEALAGRASTLMLGPVDCKTDQPWWHDLVVADQADGCTAIWFVEGRIEYHLNGSKLTKANCDHASVLVLWEVGLVSKQSRWWGKLPVVGSFSQAHGLRNKDTCRWRKKI